MKKKNMRVVQDTIRALDASIAIFQFRSCSSAMVIGQAVVNRQEASVGGRGEDVGGLRGRAGE